MLFNALLNDGMRDGENLLHRVFESREGFRAFDHLRRLLHRTQANIGNRRLCFQIVIKFFDSLLLGLYIPFRIAPSQIL
jgi:hypothetical protein